MIEKIEDAGADVLNPGQAYFHEVGHIMDDFLDNWGRISNDSKYDFYDALQKDFEKLIKKYVDYISVVEEVTASRNPEEVGRDLGIEDIVCGLGVINGNKTTYIDEQGKEKSLFTYFHKSNYYTEESIANEAFAHFFEAGMDCDTSRLEKIKEYFPTAFEVYHKIIKDKI